MAEADRLALLRDRWRARLEHRRCLIIGSAPGAAAPDLAGIDTVICVNGSPWVARRLGIERPDITVVAGFATLGNNEVRRATTAALRDLSTDEVLFVEAGMNVQRGRQVLDEAGFAYRHLTSITVDERAAIIDAVCGEPLGLGKRDDRISHGIFAAVAGHLGRRDRRGFGRLFDGWRPRVHPGRDGTPPPQWRPEVPEPDRPSRLPRQHDGIRAEHDVRHRAVRRRDALRHCGIMLTRLWERVLPTVTDRPPLNLAIFNDTGATRHYGCELVMRTLTGGLAAHGMISAWSHRVGVDWRTFRHEIPRFPAIAGIVVNGEGSIHHSASRPRARYLSQLGNFAHDELGVPAFLLNATISDIEDDVADELRAFDRIWVRESGSLAELAGAGHHEQGRPRSDAVRAAEERMAATRHLRHR